MLALLLLLLFRDTEDTPYGQQATAKPTLCISKFWNYYYDLMLSLA